MAYQPRLTHLAAAAGLLFSAQAGAFLGLPYGKAVEFSIDGLSSDTLYLGIPLGTLCASVAACDAAANTPAPGGIGSEDTWGVGNIDTIREAPSGPTLWQPPANGVSGQRLAVMFYGLTDYQVDNALAGPSTLQNILSQGGFADFYLYTDTTGIDSTAGPTGRTGLNTYPGVTNKPGAVLALRLQFVPGAIAGDTTSSYTALFNLNTTSGNGQAFLDVVGGVYEEFFDTNSRIDLNGNRRDFFLTFTGEFDPNSPPPNGWSLNFEGQMRGATPVPGTLLLLGAGLLGFGARRVWRRG